MGVYKGPSGGFGVGSPEILVNTECQTVSGYVLSANNTNLYLEASKPVTNIVIGFCDGAGQNNASARLIGIDFAGDARRLLAGTPLTSPQGTAATATFTATSGSMTTVGEILFHGDPMSQVIFGGDETYISSICLE